MTIPKRAIKISGHAHHRAVSRFGWTKPQATRSIREAIQRGDWYPSPEDPHEYLVLHRVQGTQTCIICAIQDDTVHVRTLYPLRNPGQLHAYKQQDGPFTSRQIQRHYRVGD